MKKIDFGGKPSPRPEQGSPDKWVTDRLTKPDEPIKRLTIDVSLSLHQAVKSQCAIQGENMADVIRGMLEERFASSTKLKPQTPKDGSIQ